LAVPAELENTWDLVRAELRRQVPDFKFHIWLEPLELAHVQGWTLYIRAPEHIRTSVTERYLPLVRRTAERTFHEQASVEIVAADWRPSANAGERPGPVAGGRLNPKYVFEQFVIGDGNRLAHAAALAAAEMPAQAYNPLFLHGPPGLGKTHLLHAIGNYVQRYGGGLRVRCATIEEFTSEFVTAVRERRTARFKEAFRGADVVLIDDVQFLAGRARTCEEFFHTFNALLDSGRQLVLTSDRSPDEIPDVERRLTERFRAGLVVELHPPDAAVRLAILAKRARIDRIDIPREVLAAIADQVSTSVRALEGALIRVVAHSSLQSEAPTLDLVRQALKRPTEDVQVSSLKRIMDAAADEFGVQPQALVARDRRPPVAAARQIAMYLARQMTDHSLPEIGREIGGRNHATVLHAINRINALLPSDPAVRRAVDNTRKRLAEPM
jgi:chromosomal replication initiator protein